MQVPARLDGGWKKGCQMIHEKGVILLKEGIVPPNSSGKEMQFLKGITLNHLPGQERS